MRRLVMEIFGSLVLVQRCRLPVTGLCIRAGSQASFPTDNPLSGVNAQGYLSVGIDRRLSQESPPLGTERLVVSP